MRKPFRYVSKISTIALLASGAFLVSGCEEAKVDGAVYENLEQCVADISMSKSECEKSFSAAKSQHAIVAPKFSSAKECENEFGPGRCETAPLSTSSGGSIFMPMMMGYMMGSLLGGGRYGSAQPLYKSRSNPSTFRTADNRNIGNRIGRTKISKSAASRPTPKMRANRRGGFGSFGRRLGSAAT